MSSEEKRPKLIRCTMWFSNGRSMDVTLEDIEKTEEFLRVKKKISELEWLIETLKER